MTEAPAATLPLAAIVYPSEVEIEPIFVAVRDRLAARGDMRIGGVLPQFGERLANGKRTMLLEEIATGVAHVISQDLGAGSESCTLDPDGFTRARNCISAAIEAGVDLVFAGKFGKQEAGGHGMREEIAQAVIAGVPTLVALREPQVEAWRAFAGDDFVFLPADPAAIADWAVAAAGR